MKRSEHLEPLSHDHYEGLMVAGRIKLGLSKGAEPEVIADYVANFWADHLSMHFEQEEEHLLPLRAELEDDRLLDQMLDEHRSIRSQVELVRENPGGLEELAGMMKSHIRFEERELFPLLEEELSEETLREVGAKLREEHADADLSWDPAFWE